MFLMSVIPLLFESHLLFLAVALLSVLFSLLLVLRVSQSLASMYFSDHPSHSLTSPSYLVRLWGNYLQGDQMFVTVGGRLVPTANALWCRNSWILASLTPLCDIWGECLRKKYLKAKHLSDKYLRKKYLEAEHLREKHLRQEYVCLEPVLMQKAPHSLILLATSCCNKVHNLIVGVGQKARPQLGRSGISERWSFALIQQTRQWLLFLLIYHG